MGEAYSRVASSVVCVCVCMGFVFRYVVRTRVNGYTQYLKIANVRQIHNAHALDPGWELEWEKVRFLGPRLLKTGL